MNKNPQVDAFIKKSLKWRIEYEKLRAICLDCGLSEEYKWMHPCYLFQKSNVLIIQGFKEYCAILFVKGALLKDPKRILIQQTKNVQSARQIRFANVQEIEKLKSVLKDYIYEAIEVERKGTKVKFKKTTQYSIPEEFQNKLAGIPALKTAFNSLTPGRQRAYLLYFSAPKQSKTRLARVEKCLDQIMDGVGLHDR